MTVTDAPPADASPASAAPHVAGARGFAGVVLTGDHKVVGRLYVGFSLVFLLVAVVTGLLVGVERITTDSTEVLGADTFFQVFTLYRVAAIFLVLWPLLVGIALVVVPLQVGSPTVAFPRAAAASFWGWLIGSGLLLAAYGANGGPGGGQADMVDLFVLGFALVIVSLLLASVCLVTTVTSLKADGLTMIRVPAFSWSVFVGGVISLLSFPALLANLALFYVDHRHGGRLEFGTNTSLYPQIQWAFAPPQVFVVAIPCLGLIAEVIPVFARARIRSHAAVMGAIAVAGVLAFGADIQPFFDPSATDDAAFVLAAFALVLPFLVLFGGWGMVLKDGAATGRPRLDSPLHFAFFGFGMLFAAVLAGAVRAIDALDLIGTSFDSAVFNYVFFGGLLVALGGIAYWASKIVGRRLAEPPARIAALLVFVGTIVLCVPDLWSGLIDQPDVLTPETTVRDGVEALNGVSAAGLGVIALGVLVFLLGLLQSIARPSGRERGAAKAVEDDPWEGATLEWASASPPPVGNFTGDLPAIHSATPLLDAREGDGPAKEDDA